MNINLTRIYTTSQQNTKLHWLITTALTAFSVYSGQTTVFYILYLFWWMEVLNFAVNSVFRIIQARKMKRSGSSFSFAPLFLLGIYFVFIVVFFGFIANWKNEEMVFINLNILFFKNLFFNLTLVFILFEQCMLRIGNDDPIPQTGIFSPNIIILHISIILGAIMMMFVVKRYPDTFTPENLWGSVVIIAPFLILRGVVKSLSGGE